MNLERVQAELQEKMRASAEGREPNFSDEHLASFGYVDNTPALISEHVPDPNIPQVQGEVPEVVEPEIAKSTVQDLTGNDPVAPELQPTAAFVPAHEQGVVGESGPLAHVELIVDESHEQEPQPETPSEPETTVEVAVISDTATTTDATA